MEHTDLYTIDMIMVEGEWSDDFKATFKENLRIIQNNINKLANKLNVAKKEMAELERCQTIKLRTKKPRIKKKQQTRQAKIIENSEVLDKFFPFELSKFIDIQEEGK